ncbi:uncharacterized protein L969DRAFT_25596 [Mixia osmundae IAM 14324]|uniref:Elongation factor 1 alpha-like protein n=1 Tax=Mixia osmundae (strain CBS 9802 / IAM 14324 / JCM 22182 / KY 12970) TaxID=764103 RepID=G7E4U3_MIXOS|nr:uncharacterized protein L969DRAFT_25596 [Mixia osmundae IAM 14324]KEI37716.1 hypothetical protein L969DRAFT_25596 [Mixia osmundae IAM 14324]GAA97853.1 hypothetical protein E5Q_04533 [Mixia osmundae IAM 14324]
MSRHRLVKQLDLDEELDDGADYGDADDAFVDITPAQSRQLEAGLQSIQAILGPTSSQISDKRIREALWNFYFDVDQATDFLLDEESKAQAAAERKRKDIGDPSDLSERAGALSLASPPMESIASGAPPAKLSKLQLKMQSSHRRGGTGIVPAKSALQAAKTRAAQTAAPLEEIYIIPEPSAIFVARSASDRHTGFGSVMSAAGAPSSGASRSNVAMSMQTPHVRDAFAGPSPDDLVARARKGTALGSHAPLKSPEQARKVAAAAPVQISKAATPKANKSAAKGTAVPSSKRVEEDATLATDLRALGLQTATSDAPSKPEMPAQSREQILKLLSQQDKAQQARISLVVVGHVDAGKSTLMGRLLYELGHTSDRALEANQRQSAKAGKGSFAYAWTFDQMPEERERGVTIDIALDTFRTKKRQFTLIDAPGHRDFIPNMIGGASQADAAILVVDASSGGFESGFNEGGQTREHALLVRSLGVQQLVVAINKLDMVRWSQRRYNDIVEQMQPFLTKLGFKTSKISFAPCGATSGENLLDRKDDLLKAWYAGPTLVQQLDRLDTPSRDYDGPLRLPVSNAFRGQSSGPSGLGVSGRLESGLVRVGDELAALPGDQTGIVRAIEVDGETSSWAAAGMNVTVYLSGLDQIYVNVGSVLCPPLSLVPMSASFLAQIVVFDLKVPITTGASVELFHQSREIPASVAKLEATLDKASGEILKVRPRTLGSGSSAKVSIRIRGDGSSSSAIPIETYATNRGLGRFLLRRNGETIAAGLVLELL